jgi:hypothetical protein
VFDYRTGVVSRCKCFHFFFVEDAKSGNLDEVLNGDQTEVITFPYEPEADGNITVTFSTTDPEDGTYWMPVNAGEPYYFVVRYYKPDVNNLPKKPC